jgi:hypothetical protein
MKFLYSRASKSNKKITEKLTEPLIMIPRSSVFPPGGSKN